MKLSRRASVGLLAAGLLPAPRIGVRDAAAGTPGPAQPYLTPEVLDRLPFGAHSHWLQPWRMACDTVPASALARGLGVNLHPTPGALRPGAVAMLARHGVRQARIEIGWGEVDYATESQLQHEARLRQILLACRAARIRPLILLNAHHGHPAPARYFEAHTARAAEAGARMIELRPTAERILPGLTGLCDLTTYKMNEVPVARVDGWRLHLAKPLPVPLRAGQPLRMATLRYEPFSVPGSPRNETTMRGWLRYVDLVSDFVATLLGTRAGEDRGFDLEVWNELTFGSDFLSLNNYHDPAPLAYDAREIWAELAARTARHVEAGGARFEGVAVANGFGATIPWVASSRQHPRVAAITKHPYPPRKSFPRDEPRNTTALGPDARPTRAEPAYDCFFPEYFATAVQTETLLRDLAPGPNDIYGTSHGRLARRVDGRVAPVETWLTEIGIDLAEHGLRDGPAGARLRTRFALRSALFHLGIGVERVYLFTAFGDADRYALVPDAAPTAPPAVLQALSRAVAMIEGARGARFRGPVRPLSFSVAAEGEARPIFGAAGLRGTPPLAGAEALVLLPFQSDARRLVIAYYVMTRDIREEMPEQSFRIGVEGLPGAAAARAHDPIADRPVPCRVLARRRDGLDLQVTAADTPRLLVLEL